MADRVAYGSLPFKEQIAFFRNKRNVLTEAWTDVWEAEHDHAFMVAGANRIDLLVDLRAAVDKAIAEGTGLEAFRHDFDAIVAKYGWAYNGGRNWRTRVIYETNLRTSYAAGRYAQLQALKSVRPFWRYRHSDAVQHPRPMHLAWNGLVLAADDTWWATHYPPNGWGCQCTVEALNARDLKRLGKDGPDTAPPVDMQQVLVGKNGPHPRQVETPAGVDPGFGYAPGKSAFERGMPPVQVPPSRQLLVRFTQDTINKAAQLPALAGAELLGQLLARAGIAQVLDATFTAWHRWLIGIGLAGAASVPSNDLVVGSLDRDTVKALAAAGVVPGSAPIGAGDASVARASNGGVPGQVRDADAVLLDRASGQLLYVNTGVGGPATVVRVQLTKVPGAINTYVGTETVPGGSLSGRLASGELVLLQGEL
ncbi:phage minor head protein [Rhodanobacter ginsengisoli]|uniref:Phage minor head protein n=1 Tax=Rhodanobacter ginsengisoli TaxID=418646 RepID=A0ABW0QKC1_9GAMM